MDEAALRRPIGGSKVLRGQLERLIRATTLPFSTRAHAAMTGAFTILRFAEQDLPDVVYLEHANQLLHDLG